MALQNYQNHKRYYIPHHFIFLPMVFAAMVIGGYKAYNSPANSLEWGLFAVTSFFIFYLALMLRQHYALNNQNRIVRLEFRLRYFELTGSSSSAIEKQLSFGQIAALRFAGDAEFKVLLDKAIKENLSADKIKRAIVDWQADTMRV
jgi:uncharacterized membrane protein YfcA